MTRATSVTARDFLRRGAFVGMVLLLAGMQLALRTHLVEHDLLPSSNQVCEQCVVAKATPPSPSLAVVLPPSALAGERFAAAPRAPVLRTTLVERNRGPPAAA